MADTNSKDLPLGRRRSRRNGALSLALGLVLAITATAPASRAEDTGPETGVLDLPQSDVFTPRGEEPAVSSQLPPLLTPLPVEPAPRVTATALPAAGAPMTPETFLDRLMMAESGGRADARNPRSTAVGPFQFIEQTFLEVVRRHFSTDVAGMTDPQILSLRTDREFARRAAEAFNRDNAALLTTEGVPVTYPNLRLAFLLGPTAAIRVLRVAPETPLAPLVGPAVIFANPFMNGLTAGDLTLRAARDLALPAPRGVPRPRFVLPPRLASLSGSNALSLPSSPIARGTASARPAPRGRRAPIINIQCNTDLPSCRRWVTLQTRIAVARLPAAQARARRDLSTAQR